MPVTIRAVVIPAQQRKDKSYNVKIRVTYKRKYRIISTNLTAYPRDLARSGELKGGPLFKAEEIIRKMNDIVGTLDWFTMEDLTVDDVVRYIRKESEKNRAFHLDFFEYAEQVISRKSPGTATTYRCALNSFRRFLEKDRFEINDFDVTILKQYADWLNYSPKLVGGRKVTTAKGSRKPGLAAKNYIGKMSAIYTEAQEEYNDEDAGIVRIPRNPFKHISVEAVPSVARISKSPAFIQKIIDGRGGLDGSTRFALDFYLLSFALMGANAADLLTMAPDQNGIITYYRAKTKNRRADRAEMRVRIEPCIRPLVERYRDPSGKRMFRFPVTFPSTTSLSGRLRYFYHNWADEVGEEKFSMYSARHSYATIARSNLVGLSKSLIDELLAHSTNKLVDVYAEKDWSVLWEANKKVLSVFDWTNI